MASSYEVEVKLSSANNLKNVNWRNGPNRPYAVVWVDPTQKHSTTVDQSGDTQASWDDKLLIPLSPHATVDESNIFIDVLHAATESEAKPIFIGSARLSLADIRKDVGFGERTSRTLKLKRPSGRPQGTVDVKIVIRNTGYRAPPSSAYDAPPYRVPQPAPQTYGTPYSAAPVAPTTGYAAPTPATYGSSSYSAAPPTTGYAAAAPTPALYGSSYNAAPPTTGYAAAAPYGQATDFGYGQSGSYGYGQSGQQSYGYGQAVNVGGGEKKSKFGLGTGLVMGAVVGGLGALALEKGVDAVEDKIADRAAEKVEEDFL